MFLYPFILLYRKRLIAAAIVSMLSPILTLFLVAADGPFDIGVLWRHFCGCPPSLQDARRSEEHTSELQSLRHLVCRLLLEKKHTSVPLRCLPALSFCWSPSPLLAPLP